MLKPTSDGADSQADLRGAAPIFRAVRTAGRASRAEIIESTGLSRMTLTQRLGVLLSAGLLREAETIPSGGRPTRVLTLNPEFGVILSADVGEHRIRISASDPTPTILEQEVIAYQVGEGPEATLERIAAGLEAMLARTGAPRFVVGLGISLPAPVDRWAGRAVGPSILLGWDDFDVVGWMERRLGVPTIAENDVNLMTVYECRRQPAFAEPFLFIKMGTGIGSGLISDGRLYRGAHGAAGDIGHIQFARSPAPLCRCGKTGCVEAHAAGWAIARDLTAQGFPAEDARDVLALVDRQVPEAVRLLREAGRTLGEVAADAISILNPGTLVIGGTLARAPDHLLAGVREMIYQRCLPLATRDLTIVSAPPSDVACLLGAASELLDHVFDASRVEDLLARYGSRGRVPAACI